MRGAFPMVTLPKLFGTCAKYNYVGAYTYSQRGLLRIISLSRTVTVSAFHALPCFNFMHFTLRDVPMC